MTVAELIAVLQKMPADLPVFVADWSEGYATDAPLGDVDMEIRVIPGRALGEDDTRDGALPERVLLGCRTAHS